ncbi:zinc finger protein 222-like [Penaeus monodon]|uniref:zinc finger protein 222-like n=1 Tax=Penaeus monodon TaxID=6687 RepID=UPI0018A7655A|nr:zinc finger protein 222-like [Penaeus monodon]
MYKERMNTQVEVASTRKCFVCEVCGKELSLKSHVSIHMRLHTKEKPFTSKSDLVKHVDIHTKKNPYTCEICTKAFPYKLRFLSHMIMHTEEKPYSFEFAKKTFSRKVTGENDVFDLGVLAINHPHRQCLKGTPVKDDNAKERIFDIHITHLQQQTCNGQSMCLCTDGY